MSRPLEALRARLALTGGPVQSGWSFLQPSCRRSNSSNMRLSSAHAMAGRSISAESLQRACQGERNSAAPRGSRESLLDRSIQFVGIATTTVYPVALSARGFPQRYAQRHATKKVGHRESAALPVHVGAQLHHPDVARARRRHASSALCSTGCIDVDGRGRRFLQVGLDGGCAVLTARPCRAASPLG